jgi:hypothetical protein
MVDEFMKVIITVLPQINIQIWLKILLISTRGVKRKLDTKLMKFKEQKKKLLQMKKKGDKQLN